MSETQMLLIIWILLIAIWWIFIFVIKFHRVGEKITKTNERTFFILLLLASLICIVYGLTMNTKFFVIFAHALIVISTSIGVVKGVDRED